MNSLDAMSSVKETAFTIIRGQFSDVLTMFLRKDLNTLLGDKSELSCKICAYADKETGEQPENLLIIEHALIILNRCLIFQIDSLITDSPESLFLQSLLDVQKFEFGVSDVIAVCIWDEFKVLIDQTSQSKVDSKQIRFCTLSNVT
jgi:hypothetical protein